MSMSSTHMKMMIAFRRVSTPTTPIVNSTAEKSERLSEHRRSSVLPSTTAPTIADEQQHARELEGQQVFA